MPNKQGVTNIYSRCADDGTLIADADPLNILEPPTDGGYLCSDPISRLLIIFSLLMTQSARGITPMMQKRLDELRKI